MKEAGGGKIINIGSMMSIFGAQLRAGLRREQRRHRAIHALAAPVAWAADNIQANAVPAGLDRHRSHQAGAGRRSMRPARARCLARTRPARWARSPIRRHCGAVLSSSASDFVTGTAIPVDGGFSIMG